MAKLHVVLLVALLNGCAAAQDSRPAIPDSVSYTPNIPYSQYKETMLDILQPKAPSNERRPGVIEIHGGGWVGGTKDEYGVRTCLRYVEKGFVCANIEYRLAKAATAPAAVTDVLDAAHWFEDHAKQYNVDTKRIVVTGGSAGGHLALMVGMTPKSAKLGPPAKIAAVVNFYGITDVADQLGGPHMQDYAVTWVPEQTGRLELAGRVSPMTYVRKGLPPILTIHGDADQTVPYEHGVKLTKALRDAGNDAELVSVPQGKHGFPKEKEDQIYEENIWPFLKKHGIMK
ncbi:MAG TPA: alpha/beta hydrolase [Bryobacteraceae bacterium]|nr:alpha/beta hydrolase [Bryobacteraceae bacterium]